ncbi:MAG: ester cyclase [Chloroflexi bacterium]|nr:ester cyclase [Chloroflexota bacterium]
MSQENVRIYERIFNEYWAKDDEAVLEAFVAKEHINHTLGVKGPDGYKEFMKPFRVGLPDFHFDIHFTLTDGAYVVLVWTGVGTHLGEFMGVPATRKAVQFNGTCIARFENGIVVEEWSYPDMMALMQQIAPAPQAEPVA